MPKKPSVLKKNTKAIKISKINSKSTDFFSFLTIEPISKIDIDGNAYDIFMRRYALKDEAGKPKETIEESFQRVASHVAEGEKIKSEQLKYSDLFYNLMAQKRFIPNTPTWSGSKTPLGQLAACFVLPLSDDMGKEHDGIFQTLRNAALIQQSGGGNGFSFSDLRPKGDLVKTSNGIASGPISFLTIYDTAFANVAQGGTRRGANMAVLSVDHPDIEDFITCKSAEGQVANFNISVAVTDKFMKAVETDGDFDLINPRDKKVWRTVKARNLFNLMVDNAYKNGEPGILFIDKANEQNPVPDQYTLKATNPCGEQWLGPYENCCLGHVNINESVKNGKLDWNHLKESIILGTRFLDDVVTQNKYVPAVPQLKENAHKNRRIGLGFMGLADAFYKMNIRYGSEESFDAASQIAEFLRFWSMKTSMELAKERKPFPGIKKSIYSPSNFRWSPPKALVEKRLKLGQPKLDWKELQIDIKKHGIRNSTQTTIAPTGTTSTVFGVEGYGCEPVFALAYYRNVYQSAGGQENLQLTYTSPSFKEALDKTDLAEDIKKVVVEETILKGSVQHVKQAPQNIKDVFVVSSDIKPQEHVWIQASIQAFIDNSISKTCNFPKDAGVEDVKKVYELAWKLGCKGLTVYVTGSREEVVLETKETAQEKENTSDIGSAIETRQHSLFAQLEQDIKRPRPGVVVGRTHQIDTPFGKAFITVNRNSETGRMPFEVFVNIGKAGSDSAAFSEALGRLISGWLRSSGDPDKALEEVSEQLAGIGGATSVGFGPNRVASIPDAISKVLRTEIQLSKEMDENTTTPMSESVTYSKNHESAEVPPTTGSSLCPECGNFSVIETEGCIKCLSCAYSRC